jgi:hypothetical protein
LPLFNIPLIGLLAEITMSNCMLRKWSLYFGP